MNLCMCLPAQQMLALSPHREDPGVGNRDPLFSNTSLQQRHSSRETQSQPWMGDCHTNQGHSAF